MQVQTKEQTTNSSNGQASSDQQKASGLVPPSSIVDSVVNESVTQDQNKVNPTIEFSETDSKIKLGKSKKLANKKQIPTVLGLLILFVALISGVLLFGQGTGVFAPRATPQTTPKNIRISNVTDKTFTISFYTDESTTAFVKYGEDLKKLDKQASDDRDQLSGVVKDYRLHHITVRSLNPGTDYYYVLGTGSSTFDNEGKPYKITTMFKQAQSPPNSQTIYGNVLNADGTPADGAIIYVYGESMGTLSNLIKSSGSWGIALNNAFSLDKSSYAALTDESPIEIKVQGIEPNLFSSIKTTINAAQPIANLIIGQNEVVDSSVNLDSNSDDLNKEELLADSSALTDASSSATESASISALNATSEGSNSGSLQNLLGSTEDISETPLEPEVLNLSDLEESQPASAVTITTTQPQVKATLPANTMVRVVIHSDTKIDETVQTDADGNLILDVASLGKNLEPGEHTASYTYVDPVTGKEVTKTYNFTVDQTATPRQLAAVLSPSPTPSVSIPYGSGNPYVPTNTITATPTATVTPLVSTNSTIVSTSSGQYNAGSVGTTIALLIGGIFFILAGVWSYALAHSFEQKNNYP